MADEPAAELSPLSGELVERGDLDGLTAHVDALVTASQWAELEVLRHRCRMAAQRGKQLWAVAAHIEYRLCLEAPGPWAALVLESAPGRFSLGPLPEVAASSHEWGELAPFLNPTPQAAMAAHERVLRGEDLHQAPLAEQLPEVLDLPWRLEDWEPAYCLAEYHADRLESHPPALPPLQPVSGRRNAPGRRLASGATGRGAGLDEVCVALEELVGTWTTESNGRAAAVAVSGAAPDAIKALGAPLLEIAPLTPGEAVAAMAWAAADGGAYGHRRGAAPGRFSAWWVLAAIGGLADKYPLRATRVGEVLEATNWYAWGSGEPVTGWALRLAVESTKGPSRGRAWAVAATDAA